MNSRIRLNSAVLPLLTLGSLVLELLDPSKVWRALIVAFGGAWLIGWLWVGSLKKQLHLKREVRFTWVQVGDALEEQFTLTNDGGIPATWLEIVDHSTLPDYSAARAVGVEGNETNIWRTRGVCTKRGVHTLGGTTLRSGDPFGIYSIEIHQPETSTLVVMPPVIPLPSIEVAPGGWLGEGHPQSHAPEQTMNAASVREYAHGDSLKMIHWRTTARHNKLYTRLMDGAPASDWWIVLDTDANAQAGSGWESTLELGVILAASLADIGLRAHHSVGMLARGASTERSVWLKPKAGDGHRLEILRALAMLEAGSLPLSQLLEHAGSTIGSRSSLIIVTPSAQGDWLAPLTRLTWKGIRPTVLLMNPVSFGETQQVDGLAAALTQMGIPRFILNKDLLERPEVRPGWRGQWEWHILPTGRVVPQRSPGEMAWRKLG